MNLVKSRLLNQQLVSPQYATPKDVVQHLGAMQAQDYRMVRWAVLARMKNPSIRAFELAFNSGDIVRTHLLRGTWQLLAGEDLRWMIALCGEKSKAVIKGWMSANRIAIPDDEIAQIRQIFVDFLKEKRSATKEDFVDELAGKGIVMDDHRLSYHIRFCEVDGVFCSGDLHPTKATYSLIEDKLPNSVNLDYADALTRFTRRYFQSHSPATLEDFVWWSGLPISLCRAGIASLSGELNEEEFGGQIYYVHSSTRASKVLSSNVTLLPPYDEYLIGYKSRHVVLKQDFQAKAHSKNGIFYPVFAVGGRVVGNWKPLSKTGDFAVFDGSVDVNTDALAAAFERYKLVMGR